MLHAERLLDDETHADAVAVDDQQPPLQPLHGRGDTEVSMQIDDRNQSAANVRDAGHPIAHARQRRDARQLQNLVDFTERRDEPYAAQLKADALPLRTRIAFVRQWSCVSKRIRFDVAQDLQYLTRCHRR